MTLAWLPAVADEAAIAAPTVAAPSGGQVGGFLRTLERWSEVFADRDAGPPDPALLRRDLPPRWTVETKDGPVDVPTKWLDEALADLVAHPEGWPCVARMVREQLAALAREASAPDADDTVSTLTAGAVLRRVLARPEFAEVGTTSLLDALRGRLQDWIRDHLAWLVDALRVEPVAGDLVAWAVLAAALAILALWARRAWSPPIGAAAPRPDRASAAVEEPVDAAIRARDAAGRGEHREAVRWAYAAAIDLLVARHRVRSDRSSTHRELLQRVAEADVCRPPFAELTRLFERTWYGRRQAEARDAHLSLSVLERIECAHSSPPATAPS